jgi:putative mRNA 3-end processing factor
VKPLLELTSHGLYCEQGDFFIDPWRPVEKALITHAHSDHARWGCTSYLCHDHTVPLLKLRLGDHHYQGTTWGKSIYINNVEITFFPAGHIIGSSQIRVRYKDDTWVVSGDYKTKNDGISGAFEPIPCNHFITESTFGLPIYQWQEQENVYTSIRNWVKEVHEKRETPVLFTYSLGKAQRVIEALAPLNIPIYAHGAIANTQEVLIQQKHPLQNVIRIHAGLKPIDFVKGVVIAPPSADQSSWLKKIGPSQRAICSGWMQVRGNQRRRNVDKGFVLSDHADWNGLLYAIESTGAQHILATHGFTHVLTKYLNERGYQAETLSTLFGQDEEEQINSEPS